MSSLILPRLKEFYRNYHSADLQCLNELYSEQLEFIDPLLALNGIAQLRSYFEHGREGLSYCSFDFLHCDEGQACCTIQWRMHVSHRRLNSAKRFSIEGVSVLRFDDTGLICYHRDYYDLGELFYERIAVIGAVVRALKKRIVTGAEHGADTAEHGGTKQADVESGPDKRSPATDTGISAGTGAP
ncbi:nuclear transport factor 2 family protein [Agaribacterium haliotis]|uniref:nuclear transport factor 2 family protein n=1 Tax=Agaribacterium haliotis TaxID=2013869 RepID=UPI000BB57C60|nr:nuclear transport factor 2 family protein [Agaribacterium haliotis]